MKTRAAVALEAGKPLEIMDVNLDGPRAGVSVPEPVTAGDYRFVYFGLVEPRLHEGGGEEAGEWAVAIPFRVAD